MSAKLKTAPQPQPAGGGGGGGVQRGSDKEVEYRKLLDSIDRKVNIMIMLMVMLLAVILNPLLLPDGIKSLPFLHSNNSSAQCRPIQVYHWETRLPYLGEHANCIVSRENLLNYANTAFKKHPQFLHIYTETGEDVPSLINTRLDLFPEASPLLFVVLAADEKFIFPAEFLNRTVYRILGNHTLGIKAISKEPRLLEVINLLSPTESDHFYSTVKNLQKEESKVGPDSKNSVKSSTRSSSHTWMGKEHNGGTMRWHTDAIINAVEDRIFALLRLDSSVSEPFQVVFYSKDQFYYGHHDYATKSSAPQNPYYQGGGNRLVTLILYLNDVEEGGETAFPFVAPDGTPLNRHIRPEDMYTGSGACTSGGIKVKPKKGSAVLFYNLKEQGHMDGVVDPFSLHAGCPVLKGEKFITNKWVRNKRVDGKLYDASW